MSNTLIQSLFSDMTLGVLNVALKAILPDKFDWIADAVTGAASAVDDIDKAMDLDGFEKAEAVKLIVIATLDAEDDIPGWSELDELDRDMLIVDIVELAYLAMVVAKSGEITPEQGASLGDSIGSLIGVGIRLALSSKPKAVRPVAALADPDVRKSAIDKILADMRG